MDPIAAVGAALGSLNAAIDLARSAVGAKIDSEVRAKVSDAMAALILAQAQLLDARVQMNDLVDENRKLKRELEERENWKQRVGRYELVEAPGGAMVYRFNGQPSHYVCPRCYEDKKLHILQDTKGHSGAWQCPSCGKYFNVDPGRNPSAPRGPRGGNWMGA